MPFRWAKQYAVQMIFTSLRAFAYFTPMPESPAVRSKDLKKLAWLIRSYPGAYNDTCTRGP
eukprot:1033938-Pelagomonas_calceolata.AAC.1